MEESKTRKIMFVNRKAPHGSIYAYEGLEVILIFGAYDQEISAVFLDDAVLSLKKGQDTSELGTKGFAATFKVMESYGVENRYVDRESLEQRGLTKDDLLVDVEVMDGAALRKVMGEQDVLLPF
ncbi:MAG: sulfurtransferase complex subunit TusC [Nitrospirae bacterium CG_4_9_14_3_um_filter_53_35]|nr:MAG: sulfurtransferase TusC [Nitrospirae bacterium CG2_30_53_67]PIS36665.1 MAG: sulfurtransferase complex subunit TusC [Nitrospirae bacterium CG08_land_8_20_14_0_20_52_24]PIV84589.1 MAG: sulfurtransferase complex subunit TusC [Nitrospirae bacterium CG17_big_fil_post_rev_8_21_14_2_50_50_9]PIW85959.1 MAG: sulfurtransferase complex subunit TusC [Nitrospirae bacterium CG_4_8_14_3_um_filter_50_41]PIX86041.1 MAG: sulfurtransferase complex subunit TusC [Nitrospirae bacterium CG_4_10_14_3_um_filter_